MRDKKTLLFILIAFGWSYSLWILSFIIASQSGLTLKYHSEMFEAINAGTMTMAAWLPTIITILATFGPLVASIVVMKKRGSRCKGKIKAKLTLRIFMQAVLVLLFISMLPGLAVINQIQLPSNGLSALVLVLIFFIYQVLTSGTEEFGWRGYLLPTLMEKHSLWQASMRVGIVWAIWHYPVVIYMFLVQGMGIVQLVSSLIGFTVGIMGMSVLHSYFYKKSRSVLLAVFIHAFGNTLPLMIGLFAEDAYMVSVISQFVLWAVIIVLTKVKKETFYTEPVPSSQL